MYSLRIILFLATIILICLNAIAQRHVEWVNRATGTQQPTPFEIVTDSAGNVIVTGIIRSDMRHDTNVVRVTSGTTLPDGDFYLAKYDRRGTLLWMKTEGGIRSNEGRAVDVDRLGNIYVGGSNYGVSRYGGQSIGTAGLYDGFVAKYDPNGILIWIKTVGGPGSDYVSGIAVDSMGNAYVTGYYELTANFGPTSLTALGRNNWPGAVNSSSFLIKYDPAGNQVWLKNLGLYGGHFGAVALDKQGNCFVGSSSNATVTVDGSSFASAGGQDAYVAKFLPAGNLSWLWHAGWSDNDQIEDIDVSPTGEVLVSIAFKNIISISFGSTSVNTYSGNGSVDAAIVMIDPNGQSLWSTAVTGPNKDRLLEVQIGAGGSSYIYGAYETSTNVLGTALSTLGSRYYVAKLGPRGRSLQQLTEVYGDGALQGLDQSGAFSRLNDSSFVLSCSLGSQQSVLGNVMNPTSAHALLTYKLSNQNCVVRTFIEREICLGGQFVFRGRVYDRIGRFYDTITSIAGCDTVTEIRVKMRFRTNASNILTSGPPILCPSDSLTLTANFGASYVWSNGLTTRDITVRTAGVYTVSVSDGICSYISLPLTITSASQTTPTIAVPGPINLCEGDSTTLYTTVSPACGTNLVRSNGATSPVIRVGVTGVYTVRLQTGNCQTASSIPVIVNVRPKPTAPVVSVGSRDTLYIASDTTDLTFEWYLNQRPLANTGHRLIPNVPGTYTVVAANQYGCRSPASNLQVVTGMPGNVGRSGFSVYPNPTGKDLKIVFSDLLNARTELTIQNNLGSLVQLVRLSPDQLEHQFSVENLPAGVYWLTVSGQRAKFVKR